jgi:rhomboid protease GluP
VSVPEAPLPITPDMLLSRRLDFERRLSWRPPVTLGLLAVLAAVFAIELAVEALDAPATLLALGALSRAEVLGGEAWRLLSATLLHGGLDHLLGNAVALYVLGMVGEHAFGRRQFLVLYVLSGLGGSLVSVLASPGPSVGASGAIFGLQGAAIVLFRRHRDRLLLRHTRIGVVLLAWAAYAILLGLATPYIDNGAHIGGALTGALVAWRLHPVVLSPLPAAAAARVRRWLVVVLLLVGYTLLGLLAG